MMAMDFSRSLCSGSSVSSKTRFRGVTSRGGGAPLRLTSRAAIEWRDYREPACNVVWWPLNMHDAASSWCG